jgi:NADH-quinone oxidoreductase subunit F
MKISIGELPLKSNADIILHPIKYKDSITYEPTAEEAVVALMVKYFVYNELNEDLKKFFDELDEGYLYSESNFDEFDLESIEEKLEDNNEIIIGRDILLHPRKDNILKLANLLRVKFNVNNFLDDTNLDEIDEIDEFNGSVVYLDDCESDEILISNQFKIANKIQKDKVLINNSQEKKVVLDENLKGVFGIICEKTDKYPFERVKIN